jgi:hypothetical protein
MGARINQINFWSVCHLVLMGLTEETKHMEKKLQKSSQRLAKRARELSKEGLKAANIAAICEGRV